MPRGVKVNWKNLEKSKRRYSKASKKRWSDKKYRNKIIKAQSVGRKGMKFTKIHKENIRKARLGTKNSEISKLKAKLHMLGKNKNKYDKNTITTHHIYGKQYKKTINLKLGTHMKLHRQVYWYILEKDGKRGIDNYLKWFDKKFGLRR